MHSRSAKTRADWPCAVAGELQEDTSRILNITFLKSGYLSRSAQIRADRPCAVPGELQEDTSRILKVTKSASGIKMTNNSS